MSAARRLAAWLPVMFPPAFMVPSAIVNVLCIDGALQALAGDATLRFGPRAALCAALVLLFMLLLRVYDELKDVETDLRLGRAGDPRYKDRPIVTGAVQEGDLVLLRNITLVLMVAAALALRDPLALGVFAAALGLCWLSSRWFFWPPISTNILLAFVTHNPLSLAISAVVVAAFAGARGVDALGPWTAPLLVGLWTPVAAWETSRKLRTPEEETDYQTYSKVLGLRAAALVPGGFVLLSAACLAGVAWAADLGPAAPGVIGAAALGVAGAALRLSLRPTPARAARLRPLVEGYALVANVGLVAALVWARGVSWGA
ncbi:MAG: UbiA family prenyltransferase [Planctomycetes bacterium]|nr:UbiA family prenyltransferase [Planctomycetota bacterium]